MPTALIEQLVSLLYPDILKTNNQTGKPTPHLQTFLHHTYALPYQTPTVRNLISQAKYHHNRSAWQSLAQTLEPILDQYQPDLIIPIPQSLTRWRERGFDPLQEILSRTRYAHTMRTSVLKKQHHTPRQAHAEKHIRITQQKDSFQVVRDGDLTEKKCIILFDDVVTTGSTLAAASATLQPHLPPETTLVTLALAH